MENTISNAQIAKILSPDRVDFLNKAVLGAEGAPVKATTQDMTLYVRDGGSDDNDGLQEGSAFKTLQTAMDSLPTVIKHAITIDVGEGNFAGFILSDKIIQAAQGGSITIQGTLGSAVLAAGTGTGTATSGSTTSLTDSAQAWVVNALRGKLVRVGAEYRVVRSNTSTAIQFVGAFSATCNGEAYEILQHLSLITSVAAEGSGYCGLEITRCSGPVFVYDMGDNGGGGAYPYHTDAVRFIRYWSSGSYDGIYAQNVWGAELGMDDCYVEGSSSVGYAIYLASRIRMNRCYAYNCGSHGFAFEVNGGMWNNYLYADGNTKDGIRVLANHYVSLGLIYMDGNGYHGLEVYGQAASWCDVNGGTASANGKSGIAVGLDDSAVNRLLPALVCAMGTLTCSNNGDSGVVIGLGSAFACSTLTGIGNTRYGIELIAGASQANIKITAATSITGVMGDATIDEGSTVLDWATDFAADRDAVINVASGSRIERQD